MTKGTPKTRHNRTSKKGKVFPAGRGHKKNSKKPVITNPFKYHSDNLRLTYIKFAKPTSSLDADPEEFSEDNDFIVAKKKGTKLHYNEKWLESCWEGLMRKEESKGLGRTEALLEFIKGRLTKIAGKAGYEVKGYSYDNYTDIMKVRMEMVK